MDSINSFKGYGKVDPVEEQAFRKKSRKRVIIVIISAIVLLAIIIGVVAGTLIHKNNKNDENGYVSSSDPSAALKAVCGVTQNQESCFSSISELESTNTTDPEKIFQLSLKVVTNSLQKLSNLPQEWMNKAENPMVKKAITICQNVIDDAIDRLNESIALSEVNNGEKIQSVSIVNDLKTWLSTAITDQETCLEALEEVNATIVEEVRHLMKNSTEFASNSLAIVTKIIEVLGNFKIPLHRKLLAKDPTRQFVRSLNHGDIEFGHQDSEFPEWMGEAERRLLQVVNVTANITVAADGTGDFVTLKEAFATVAKKSKIRTIIHLKAGKYVENVVLDKSFWNIMLIGDGKTKTIISGSKNFVDGTPTFDTATFAIQGRGFIAKDIRFENTAGAAKHQAVALRSQSDLAAFYRCSFDAFQDTLYPHSNRQFYRECDITGTIDFIFGNAAVVFQNCNIQPRQPLSNQFVTITAQGKKDPNQNTGISIQKCSLSPLDKLTAPTYLGRPWKQYSTTIIMQSEIGAFLQPIGWIEWVRGVEPPSSIFYAEYQNTGPGADVSQRVKWAGYKSSVTAPEATKFTVESFIQGGDWLPEAGVLYDTAL
ncbi:esterase [Lithospermum erythrorhizon]|uniref:Pectinesterase n=1 Tax=Lithospermum erythrorhizon TaxID=34254 RepID=A0AAV3RFB7_LITER